MLVRTKPVVADAFCYDGVALSDEAMAELGFKVVASGLKPGDWIVRFRRTDGDGNLQPWVIMDTPTFRARFEGIPQNREGNADRPMVMVYGDQGEIYTCQGGHYIALVHHKEWMDEPHNGTQYRDATLDEIIRGAWCDLIEEVSGQDTTLSWNTDDPLESTPHGMMKAAGYEVSEKPG